MVWHPGHQLYGNRYVIEKKLGEGGFGITYLAKDRQGKRVVIKTLKDEVMDNPDFADFRDKYKHDFRDEALRLAVCRHPHIVQIENVFHHESLPCIAMEYIEGEDLSRRVKTCGVLAEMEALQYIQQIGEALTIVHDKGLLHRDVKPQNIMVCSHRSEAVLIDFGLAREFIPDLTQTHTVLLTAGYAPIEQYDDQARRGEFTDVYALAATLYYLLTGRVPPFAFNRIIRDSLQPPAHFNQTISEPVNQAILGGMALEAENRPQSVQEWLKLFQSDTGNLPSEREGVKLFQSDTDDLPSEKGIDYCQLRDYLKAGNWKEADKETAQVMAKAVTGKKEGLLRVEDIDNFPCTDLRTIDQLWVKYSKGQFGFSVQKRIYQSLGGTKEYDKKIWEAFGEGVGWRVNNSWQNYDELQFNTNPQQGHFPAFVTRKGKLRKIILARLSLLSLRGMSPAIFSRLDTCKV
ncbi:serine/threonine-protein kinase [Microcoleus sp. FACHB-68]|uniref:serine/threonine-protein kinase n=1 Tax=Microcoleus sp. FACHB-68 TaxID=2692826 RepID=UPI001683CFF4|nr:serine/threonine-protein kinase [Microcoleus sp. FACHB-68]MBD1937227.1 GUN4 domain-containing protein [Microcoleus sp. FACHB-68]